MWIQHPQIIGKNQYDWTWLGHTCHSQVTQWLIYFRYLDVLKFLGLGCPYKCPGVAIYHGVSSSSPTVQSCDHELEV